MSGYRDEILLLLLKNKVCGIKRGGGNSSAFLLHENLDYQIGTGAHTVIAEVKNFKFCFYCPAGRCRFGSQVCANFCCAFPVKFLGIELLLQRKSHYKPCVKYAICV